MAIVGHRPERLADPAAVQERLGELLGRLDGELAALPTGDDFDAAPPRLRLITALAEGADRLGAAAALDRGLAVGAILPFPVGEYERDFPEASAREAFQRLVARCETVLVLDGAGQGATRDRAYDAAGRALLDNGDLLIAVWDGKPGRGRGGTHDVVAEAIRRGLPVITVSPDGAQVALRLPPSDPAGAVRLEDVAEIRLETSGPIVGLIGCEQVEPPWPALLRTPWRPLLFGAYPMLLALIGLGRKGRGKGLSEADSPSPQAGSLEQAFAWWDASAVIAAQAFRSAVIVNFALAALAVVLAVASLFSGHAKWLFVLAEIAAILLLLINTWGAGRSRWQDRWLESREVAERLRVCLMLRQVGVGRAGAAEGEPGWKAWYVRALARGSALQAADLSDVATASRDLVAGVSGQAAWNAATATRMHLAGHRIERVGEVLFVAVLAAAVGWLVLWVMVPEMAKGLKYALTAATAGLPAIATASYGIRIILDFEGVAERSHRMATALEGVLKAWSVTPAGAAALQSFAVKAGGIMLSDVTTWRLLAEGRRLSIPG